LLVFSFTHIRLSPSHCFFQSEFIIDFAGRFAGAPEHMAPKGSAAWVGEQFHKLAQAGRYIGRDRRPKLLCTHARPSSHVIRRAFNALKVTGERVGVAGSKERPELRQMRA
jgi:hypothetical protein